MTHSTPRIVINLSGGLVQSVACNTAAEVAVVDWDTEGATPEDGAIETDGCSSAFVTIDDAESLAGWQGGDVQAVLHASGCDWQFSDAAYILFCGWSPEDVQEVRPDLSPSQAIQVLRRLEEKTDASVGVNWDMLECFADELYPANLHGGES